ncbi:MAG: hypothetical protein ABSG78_19220 [Verrucomicrobiota bacterium]|jgi:hypothetical protein
MSVLEIIVGLAAVAVLLSYLCLKHRQRKHSRSGRDEPAEWTGKGMDVTALKPAIEGVRRDYLAGRHSARGIFCRRSLIRLARRTIARMAYFHSRESQEHEQIHRP